MDIQVYNLIHLVSIMALFAALGSIAASECDKCKKLGAMLHGIALVLLAVSGMAMFAKLGAMGVKFPVWWLIAKFVIWIGMGGMLVVAKRRLLPCGKVIAIILALGAIAAYLGIYGRALSAAG
jgi:hypothetical protein